MSTPPMLLQCNILKSKLRVLVFPVGTSTIVVGGAWVWLNKKCAMDACANLLLYRYFLHTMQAGTHSVKQ